MGDQLIIDLSPNNTILVAAASTWCSGCEDMPDSHILLFNFRTMELFHRTATHYIETIRWSPDGTQFVTDGYNSSIDVYTTRSQWIVNTVPLGNTRDANDISFNTDGTRLVIVTDVPKDAKSQRVIMFNTDTWTPIMSADAFKNNIAMAHNDYMSSVAFSPDGIMLATGDEDGVLVVSRFDEDEFTFQQTIIFDEEIEARAISWSPNGIWISVGYDDDVVRLYSARCFYIKELYHHANCCEFKTDKCIQIRVEYKKKNCCSET